jgi:hypothetical protein
MKLIIGYRVSFRHRPELLEDLLLSIAKPASRNEL